MWKDGKEHRKNVKGGGGGGRVRKTILSANVVDKPEPERFLRKLET